MAKILVIDDEHAIGVLMSRVIEQMGNTAVYADTLKTGMQAVDEGNFDIVFLDVQLPDGNGLQQVPVLREISSAPEVIIITGFANSEGAEEALSSDAWDYIQKPVSIGSTVPLAGSESVEAGILGIDPLAPDLNFYYMWWREL